MRKICQKIFNNLKTIRIKSGLSMTGKKASDRLASPDSEMDTFYPVADPPANMLDKIYPGTGPFIGERSRRPCPFIENHLQNREHPAGAAPV
jgi:hypothetical protein